MIQTSEDLARLVERAAGQDIVALDTEFVWERTYYPQLGLVQIGLDGDDVHLVDTVQIDDLSALGHLLADSNVCKLLHDASQDLQILTRATGSLPANVFDTQRAAGFVGLSSTTSLQDLVEWATGIRLDKGETRTNWLQRPLTENQLRYAENDVRYMPEVYRRLREASDASGRTVWVEEEMERFVDPALFGDPDPGDAVSRLKVSGIGRLSGRQRAVLRALAAWREVEARNMDRTRRMVLPDEALFDIALKGPRTAQELSRLRLSDKQEQRYGEGLLAAIEEGFAAPQEPVHRRGRPGPEDERDAARLLVAQALLAGRSARDGVDATLVATKSDLKAIVEAGPEVPSMLAGWRDEFFGRDLTALLEGRLSVCLAPDDGWPAPARD